MYSPLSEGHEANVVKTKKSPPEEPFPTRSLPIEVCASGRHSTLRRHHRPDQWRCLTRTIEACSQDSLTPILADDSERPPSFPEDSRSYQPKTPASEIYASPTCSPKGRLILMDSSSEFDEEGGKTVIPSPTIILPLFGEMSHSDDDDDNWNASPPQSPPQNCHNVTASSGPICRICHEGDQLEGLSSLCKCSGTMGLSHVSCLERWLNTQRSDRCELCHHRFTTSRNSRRFSQWVCSSDRAVQRALVGDLFCFVLLTPIAVVSGYLCIQGATRRAIMDHVWETASMITLASLLLIAYAAWTFLTVRFHYRSFLVWRAKNPTLRIIIARGDTPGNQSLQGRELVDVASVGRTSDSPRTPSASGSSRRGWHNNRHTFGEGILPGMAFW